MSKLPTMREAIEKAWAKLDKKVQRAAERRERDARILSDAVKARDAELELFDAIERSLGPVSPPRAGSHGEGGARNQVDGGERGCPRDP